VFCSNFIFVVGYYVLWCNCCIGLYFRILPRNKLEFVILAMGSKLSCIKRPHRSRAGHDNASSSGAAAGRNQQHPSSSSIEVTSPRRIVVSQNGRQIIRTVRTLQSGDSIVVTYPRTDLKTLILDTLRLLRSLVAKQVSRCSCACVCQQNGSGEVCLLEFYHFLK